MRKLFAVLLAIALVAVPVFAFGADVTEDFEAGMGNFRAIVSEEEAVQGEWVVEDGVLKQTFSAPGTWFEGNAVFDGYTVNDFTLKVDMKGLPSAGWVGIHLMKANPDDAIFQSGLILFISGMGDVMLTDAVDGKNETIQGVGAFALGMQYNTVEVIVDGTYCSVYVNDELALEADLPIFGEDGYIGLVAGGGEVEFDNFSLMGATMVADDTTTDDTTTDDTTTDDTTTDDTTTDDTTTDDTTTDDTTTEVPQTGDIVGFGMIALAAVSGLTVLKSRKK